MVDVRRSPYNRIPKAWAFDQEIGDFIREIMRQVDEVRRRTGGDSDIVNGPAITATLPDFFTSHQELEETYDFTHGASAEEVEFSKRYTLLLT